MNTPEGHAELLEAVSDETARDIIEQRRKKKVPFTKRAARIFRDELLKIPPELREQAVDEWINCGWTGFYADSLLKRLKGPPQRFPQAQTGGAPRTFDYQPQSNVVSIKKRKTAFQEAWERGEFKKAGE